MKYGILCLGLLAAWAAQAQRNRDDDTEATKRACSVEECFLERDIRDFEVIDRTHVIVYTGAQRCAFHVEVRGTFCDLTFAPQLYFSRSNELPDALSGADRLEGFGARGSDLLNTPNRRNLRICSNDLGIQVHGGQFTESTVIAETSPTAPRDRFGNARVDCRIASVTSITDDQLVELYVKRRVIPPLPPMGTGEIEVGEQEEQGAEGGPVASEPPASEAAARESRGRRR
jgi:hypothetical protein